MVTRTQPVLPLFLAALAVLFPFQSAYSASFPPSLRFRTITTDEAIVHFPEGAEALARRAAALADEILRGHQTRYGMQVRRVHIVLADVDDDPNGSATPLPYPLVQVRLSAPRGNDELGNHGDWLRLVLTHELAHIVHLDQARGIVHAGRKLLGRSPYLFPNGASPSWLVEGLATYEETEHTAFGRGRNPDAHMVVRMAALESDFLEEDEALTRLDRWPGGQAGYLFGEAFLRSVSDVYGKDTLPRLARAHAGRLIPFLDELTARKVTGAGYHRLWNDWQLRAWVGFRDEAARREAQGLTASQALTDRGVRQMGARFSPDGQWIAYTSRRLDAFREIRVMRADGTGDRAVTRRNAGITLAWTPDGRALVFDQPDVYRTDQIRSDLYRVEVAGGRVRRLSRGARLFEPDVAPDGSRVVAARRDLYRTEIAFVDTAGGPPRDLTASEPGTHFSGPRFSSDGARLVASRLRPGGFLDVVLVDPATGVVEALTDDRAKDVEPTFTPDGRAVVFRSDRDGVSNLYAVRLDDRVLRRVTNVIGGAFTPDVAPDGARLAFANYRARGYDVHAMALGPIDALPLAEPFVDPYGEAPPEPPPAEGRVRPYRPWTAFWPRFWSPYVFSDSGETKVGVVTAGADPLLRHAYGIDVERGFDTDRFGVRGYYFYDRWRPTLSASVEQTFDPQGEGVRRTREVVLRASVPIRARLRSSNALSVAWRRSRDSVVEGAPGDALDLGGIEVALSRGTTQGYAYSISPVDGYRARVAVLRETPGLGSEVRLWKGVADLRGYLRGFGRNDVLALRAGGGATFGQPRFRSSYAVGGFPDGSLFDVVATNHSVLRGYEDDAYRGRKFVHANAEYRVALAHPQRGFRTGPIFLRSLHAAAFVDAAQAWSGPFALERTKTGVGAALATDLVVGHALPVTLTVGLARGLDAGAVTRVYTRTGLSF